MKASVLVVAGLAVLVVPFIMPGEFFQHLLVMSVIFSLLALGYNAQFGYAGLFNLGHSAFFGLGAYTSAILTTGHDVPYLAGLLAGLALSALIAFAMGLLTLRTRGPQFAMMTLGLGQVFYLVAVNWVDMTRGPLGITGIPSPHGPGGFVAFDNEISFYYLALSHLLVGYLTLRAILSSRMGSAWHCVRENEDLASALGVDPRRAKVGAFVFGSLLASAAGTLYAHYIHLVTPEMFSVHYVIVVLIMVVVGGQGTFYGPILGAVLFTIVPEGLRFTEGLRMAVFGLLLLVFVLFLPGGLGPMLKRMGKRLSLLRADGAAP
jgi:branched-chain amino acid transport system permease protein